MYRSILLDIFDENFEGALAQLSSFGSEAFSTQWRYVPKALLYAQIRDQMGDRQLALTYYESARLLLEAKVEEEQEDARLRSALGIAYAGLDQRQKAIDEGKRAVELMPWSKVALRGPFRIEDLARIYVMVGESDAAIDQLEFLLSIPAEISIHLLQLDPAWDPLRNHPRFKKLIETYK